MADNKRQSGGKVATPKTGGAKDMVDMGENLSKAIGGRVKVTVAPLNVTYDGFLFTADPITNLIVINTRPAPPDPAADYWKQPADLHVIPVCHITSFTVMELGQRAEGAGQGFDGCLPPIGPLDMRAIEARERATIKKMKEDEARLKAGVTPEGQEVYDALSRTLPCRWHETSIIVSDAVIIKPPYGINDCQAPKDKLSALNHVKKIMGALQERKKPTQSAQNSANANRPAVATPIAPRKGG